MAVFSSFCHTLVTFQYFLVTKKKKKLHRFYHCYLWNSCFELLGKDWTSPSTAMPWFPCLLFQLHNPSAHGPQSCLPKMQTWANHSLISGSSLLSLFLIIFFPYIFLIYFMCSLLLLTIWRLPRQTLPWNNLPFFAYVMVPFWNASPFFIAWLTLTVLWKSAESINAHGKLPQIVFLMLSYFPIVLAIS